MEFCCRYFYIPNKGPRTPNIAPTNDKSAQRESTKVYGLYDNDGIESEGAAGLPPAFQKEINDQEFKEHLTPKLASRPTQPGEKGRSPETHLPLDDHEYLEVLPSFNDTSADHGRYSEFPHPRAPPPVPRRTHLKPLSHPSDDHEYLEVLPSFNDTSADHSRYSEFPHPQAPPPVPRRTHLKPLSHPSAPPPEHLQVNCNIVLFNVSKLVDVTGQSVTEGPIFCQQCTAALSATTQVDDQEFWHCDFCGTSTPVERGCVAPNPGDDNLYMGFPDQDGNLSNMDDPVLVFCIDTSGSMCVTSKEDDEDHEGHYTTRMQEVKSGLLRCLAFLKQRYPSTRVALVTFSDQVLLYGDGMQEPQKLQDCELLDQDYLRSQGQQQPLPHRLTDSLEYLEATVQRLEETGATALGPAALVSIAIASLKPGSKVIICTDGKANTDLGNLEDCKEDILRQYAKLFYTDLAEFALMHSVVVSVLTIEGTDCSLLELGQLASKTGGKVNIVPPKHLYNEFQSIVETEVIATNVKLKIFLPLSMFFLYEERTLPILDRPLGSISGDTELTFEFSTHESKHLEILRYSELPFQAQLSFTMADGQPVVRILSQKRPVTNDSSAALDTIDVAVLQTHSAQVSARLAMEGRVEEARDLALAQKQLIEQVMSTHTDVDRDDAYEEWESAMAPIYEDLEAYRAKGKASSRDPQDDPTAGSKTFSDEMASMMFHLKHAKQQLLRKLKPTHAV
ncbi:circularly permutated Ras protein 1-like isoform X2 [Pleurodeles waltl]|uniref:circularly permutated Ras protein 1-like isoform X2 n=1 Tax=Pleurodeles waltl TaxID=8319 RepID=UPI0037095F74